MTRERKPEKMLAKLYDRGLRHVILKLGTQGAMTIERGELIHALALEVTPLDTTGAGDCFDAGFLYAWLNNLPMEQCLLFGNICGARATLSLGGVHGFSSLEIMKGEACASPFIISS